MAIYPVKVGCTGGTPGPCSIARKSNGEYWVAYTWVSPAGINYVIVDFSTDVGATWTNSLIITDPLGVINYFTGSLAFDSTDKLHLAYTIDLGVAAPIRYFMGYRTMVNGAPWSAESVISGGSIPIPDGHGRWGTLAIDSLDRIHLAYNAMLWAGTWGVYYRLGLPSGAWGAVETVHSVVANPGCTSGPSLAIDALNVPHVAWDGLNYPPFGFVFSVKYNNRAGGAWGAQESIGAGAGDSYMTPSIVIDAAGIVHCVLETPLWSPYARYRRRDAGVWLGMITPTTPRDGHSPSIALNELDDIHVFTTDVLGGPGSLYVTKAPLGDWSSPWVDSAIIPGWIAGTSTLHKLWPLVHGARTNSPLAGYIASYVSSPDVGVSWDVLFDNDPVTWPVIVPPVDIRGKHYAYGRAEL